MNICITGPLGHIGSALIRNLPSSVNRVHLIDNMYKQRYYSLFDLPDKHHFVFHQIDIFSKEMEKIIRDCHIVIHLAAISDAESSMKEQKEVNRVNKKGLGYIIDLCAKYDCSLFFPSTTSVYGSSAELVDESAKGKDLQPQTPYAESKLYGERLLKMAGKKQGLKYVIVRFGTIFGYSIGMRFNTAVNKFGFQAASNQSITVWKTAYNQKRPYCDLADCICAINHIITHNLFDNEIYNIVTVNVTVKDIIDTIKKYIPHLKISFVDSPIMNKLSYAVSNEKSLKKGFAYKGNLDKSVREYIRKLRNINSFVIKKNL